MAAICGRIGSSGRIFEAEVRDSLISMSSRGGPEHYIHVSNGLAMGTCKARSEESGFLWSREQGVCIALDGNIYNINEIAADHHLQKDTALDVLISLYRRCGESCLSELNGIFALALWDEHEKKLLLARDHIGGKPLFYAPQGKSLFFSSEIRGLLAFRGIETKINLHSLDAFLRYSYVPPPNTFFADVYQVKPGHFCRVSGSGMVSECSHSNDFPVESFKDDLGALSSKLRELMFKSLDERLNGGNVGFLLSGGVDTAALVGCASSLSSRKLKTFTLGFSDCPQVDERNAARKTAKYFNTDHTELETNRKCIEELQEVTRRMGNPAGNPAALISSSLFGQLRGHIDFAVCGDGGNEIFGGTYKYHHVMNFLASSGKAPLKKLVRAFGQRTWKHFEDTGLEGLFQRLARNYFGKISKNVLDLETALDETQFYRGAGYYAAQVSTWNRLSMNSLYSPEIKERLKDFDSRNHLIDQFRYEKNHSLLQQIMYVRTTTIVPGNYIPYVEFNAVSCGVHPLFPFLDKNLLSFMYKAPFEYTFGIAPRFLMEEAIGNTVIPMEIFKRPYKGFKAPIDAWLKSPLWKELIQDYLKPESLNRHGLFSVSFVQDILKHYYSGRKLLQTEENGVVQSLSEMIWSLFAVSVWLREFL